MEKYEIFDYIIQSRISMNNMPDDLLKRAYLSLRNEIKLRKLKKQGI